MNSLRPTTINGTQITGLTVPASQDAGNAEIELDISVVPTQAYPEPFRYGSLSVGSSGCGTGVATDDSVGALWLLGLLLATLAAWWGWARRR